MLHNSTLPNVKCKFKFNILIYSQKSNFLTYFEKRRRILHKDTVLSKLWMRDRSLPLFPFQFDIAFNFLLISTFFSNFVNMQETPHQMKDLSRSYCFSSLYLLQKRNLKNIVLTLDTSGKTISLIFYTASRHIMPRSSFS